MRKLLLFFVTILPLFLFGFVPSAHAQSFSFGAAGDFGTGSGFQSVANGAGSNGLNFFVTLGDNSYSAGSEQSWCSTLTAKVPNIAMIAGNHDVGESSGGDINKYRQFCKYTATPITGDFGKQYYFDYPATNPIARFIMITPGVKGSLNISYAGGNPGYTFTSNAIDDARSKGIKWIIVGMHKNYITAMEKSNEVGADLIPMLMTKKVDLILQGHEHGYERSKQLKCAKVGSYDATCVVDADASMVQGAGTIIDVLGTGGQTPRDLNTGDAEYQYFAATNNTANGFGKFTVSPTQISYNFVRTAGGSFSDAFTIAANATAPSTPPPGPSLITPTLYCLGGAPCTSPEPTSSPTPPTDGTNPTGTVTISPSPADPCSNDASVQHFKKHKKHKRGDDGGFLSKLFEFLMQLIELLLKQLGAPMPENPNPVDPQDPVPTPEPAEPTPCPGEETPTTEPTIEAAPSVEAAESPAPTGTQTGGTEKSVEITFYGAYDNDPKGSKEISNPVKHQEAGGTGTFADPLTFASPEGAGAYPVGSIIYVPLVQKYFIREDVCAQSWTAPNGCGAVSHVDLYMGNPSDSQSVLSCEEALTPSGNAKIIVDPPAGLTVDPKPLWEQSSGTCMSPH